MKMKQALARAARIGRLAFWRDEKMWEDWDSGNMLFSGRFEGDRWAAEICKQCHRVSHYYKLDPSHHIDCDCSVPCRNYNWPHACGSDLDEFAFRLQRHLNDLEKTLKRDGRFVYATGFFRGD